MTVSWNGVYPAATTQFALDESFDLNELNATAVCRQNSSVMQKRQVSRPVAMLSDVKRLLLAIESRASIVTESPHFSSIVPVEDGRRKTWLERILSLFADVRAGDGTGPLLMALNGILWLTEFYLTKAVCRIVRLGPTGPEKAAYTAAGTALLLLLLVPMYAAFACQGIRVKLNLWVMPFSRCT